MLRLTDVLGSISRSKINSATSDLDGMGYCFGCKARVTAKAATSAEAVFRLRNLITETYGAVMCIKATAKIPAEGRMTDSTVVRERAHLQFA
ncbi:MAG: hypothetical protein KDB27_25395 [Planctomycetales bacterium]|nr:hypothetical protein [Planctomycetales bacterium]